MGDFWKPTSDMFSSLFEKPKMSEKLLLKPPFRYIFDIVTETTKVTGWGRGLFNAEEQSGDYYETRDRKIAYLQKLIELMRLMGEDKIEAKPKKIVAGLEPEHTNTMLQAIYKLAVSGTSSEPYVKKLFAGGKEEPKEKPKPAEEKPKKEEPKEQPAPPAQPKQFQRKGSKKSTKVVEQPKPEVEEKKAPLVRPPSPKKGGQSKPPVEAVKPAPPPPPPPPPVQKVVEEEEARPKVPQREINPEGYSKNVKEAMEQNEQIREPEEKTGEPSKTYTMGKVRKNKAAKGESEGMITSAGGEITEKEIELLKNVIQTICQNSTPLGKSIEFINDDVEAMNQELLFWRKQYTMSKAKMQNELKISEDALVPLYDKLAEIDEQIKDQKAKIQNAKSQIIKNQSTISSLLYSVVTTK